MDQSSVPLFDVSPERRRRAKPPTDTDITFNHYRDAYKTRTGQDLLLPSGAAWGEAKRQCKRLVVLVPDPDLRDAFLDLWFATRDRYVIDRGYPLRLALRDETFQKLLRDASRMTAERRRAGEPVNDTKPTVARPLGRLWCVEVVTYDGLVLGADHVHAVDEDAALRVGRRKLARLVASDLGAEVRVHEVGR